MPVVTLLNFMQYEFGELRIASETTTGRSWGSIEALAPGGQVFFMIVAQWWCWSQW